jgi:hypothetical protein
MSASLPSMEEEDSLPSLVEIDENTQGCLRYRLPTRDEVESPKGRPRKWRPLWHFLLPLSAGVIALEGPLNLAFYGLFLPLGWGTVQVLMCWAIARAALCRETGHSEVLITPRWLGFRRRPGWSRWTRWCRLERLERLVVRSEPEPGEWEWAETWYSLVAVSGRRRLRLPWFGTEGELGDLARHLAAECTARRGPAALPVAVTEENVEELV